MNRKHPENKQEIKKKDILTIAPRLLGSKNLFDMYSTSEVINVAALVTAYEVDSSKN